MVRNLADITYKTAKRIVVSVVGGTVVLIGIAMLVLPGPGTVVIPVGLAILGIEFAWARRFLKTIRDKGGDALRWCGLRKAATTVASGGASGEEPDEDAASSGG